jgi:signal transduction histidine kinase
MDTMSVDVATARSTASIAGARESARDFLDGLAHPIAAEAADTVVLVVSELVTNAIRHGGGTCTLDLTAHRTASRWPCTTTARRPRACAPPT